MNAASDVPHPQIPDRGALLGVDFGTKRVGLAICTPDQTIASPLEIHQRGNAQQDARKFKELVGDYRIAGLVVGLPIHLSGNESQKSAEARKYADWLSQTTGLPIALWDERFTSAVAEDYLLAAELTSKQRKRRIDMLAAQILLQAFLDARRTARQSSSAGETDDDAQAR